MTKLFQGRLPHLERPTMPSGLTGPYTPAEVETIYFEMMKAGYYDQDYNKEDWKPEPYKLMANILRDTFRLSSVDRVLDLGCGVGFLLQGLRDNGIDAEGIEFSSGIYERIAKKTKEHARLVGVDEFYQKPFFSERRLVISLEVFEHLPVSIIRRNLEKLRAEHAGQVFLTIPSFGYSQSLPAIGYAGDTNKERVTDVIENRLFSYQAMERGWPGGGHITLASYRWWTDFFFAHGFVRNFEAERRFAKYEDILKAYNWCPYVLEQSQTGLLHYGANWHDLEAAGERVGRWSKAGGDFYFDPPASHHRVHLRFDPAPAMVNADPLLRYLVLQEEIDEHDLRIRWRPLLTQSVVLEPRGDGQPMNAELPLPPLQPRGRYRLVLDTPMWSPKDHMKTHDSRQLGIFVREALLA